MPLLSIRHANRSFTIEAPPSIAADVVAFFPFAEPGRDTPEAVLRDGADGTWSLAVGDAAPRAGLARGDVMARLAEAVTAHFATRGNGFALRAAAVGWAGNGVLIAGPDGSGKSSLAAWLVERGLAFAADDLVSLTGTDPAIAGLATPITVTRSAADLAELPGFRNAASVRAGDAVLVRPEAGWLMDPGPHPCRLIIFPHFAPGTALRIVPIIPAETERRLQAVARHRPTNADIEAITATAAQVPAVIVEYGAYAALAGIFDAFARFVVEEELSPSSLARFLGGFATRPAAAMPAAPVTREIPAATDRKLNAQLTIGMATYDDYDGVYFSIQAIRMFHPEIANDVEFLVIDNHPDGPCAEPLKHLEHSIPNFRYVPYPDAVGTAAAKDRVFAEASGEIVLCIDSHVFIVPGAIQRLLAYYDAHPGTRDLLQGPLVYDDLKSISTHFQPGWRGGMYGTWETDPAGADPEAPPFEIPMQGMGLFSCRREAWPGFNPAFRGFGGEEGYIHEKVRQHGGRVLCLPFLRWMHRFQRPMGPSYRNTWEDRIRNYVIGHREFGLAEADLRAHFAELLGSDQAQKIFADVERELGAPPH